jgi:hypothetical protein
MKPMLNGHMRLVCAAAICTLMEVGSAFAADEFVESLSSSAMIGDVIAKAENPYVFDWRKSSVIVEAGPVMMLDNNSFKSSGHQLSLGFPLVSGHLIKVGFRRIKVESTDSSLMLARTPFTQSALMTRFEFLGSYGYNLLEGRNISKLSSRMGDLETVFWLLGGGHYSMPNKTWYPSKGQKPTPLPAQDAVNSAAVLDLGLMWQVFFPNALGLMAEFSYHFPLTDTGQLKRWNSVGVGLTWAFGVR